HKHQKPRCRLRWQCVLAVRPPDDNAGGLGDQSQHARELRSEARSSQTIRALPWEKYTRPKNLRAVAAEPLNRARQRFVERHSQSLLCRAFGASEPQNRPPPRSPTPTAREPLQRRCVYDATTAGNLAVRRVRASRSWPRYDRD